MGEGNVGADLGKDRVDQKKTKRLVEDLGHFGVVMYGMGNCASQL